MLKGRERERGGKREEEEEWRRVLRGRIANDREKVRQ